MPSASQALAADDDRRWPASRWPAGPHTRRCPRASACCPAARAPSPRASRWPSARRDPSTRSTTTSHDDDAGHALLRALRDAAQRGVRVRLLVDDLYSRPSPTCCARWPRSRSARCGCSTRLPVRGGPPLARLALSLARLRAHQPPHAQQAARRRRRGARSTADATSATSTSCATARPTSSTWTCCPPARWCASWPPPSTCTGTATGSGRRRRCWARPATPNAPLSTAEPPRRGPTCCQEPPRDVLGQTPVATQLAAGRLTLHFGAARVAPDAPEKASAASVPGQPGAAMRAQLDIIEAARSDVALSSPYFLPGGLGLQLLLDARQRGIQALVLTNSLGSTDEPLVYFAYAPHRADMLRQGDRTLRTGADAGARVRRLRPLRQLDRPSARQAGRRRPPLAAGRLGQLRCALGHDQHRDGRGHRLPRARPGGDARARRRRLPQHVPAASWRRWPEPGMAVERRGRPRAGVQRASRTTTCGCVCVCSSSRCSSARTSCRTRPCVAQGLGSPAWSGACRRRCLPRRRWLAPLADARAERYALLVGVSRYAVFAGEERWQLAGPANDVQLMRCLARAPRVRGAGRARAGRWRARCGSADARGHPRRAGRAGRARGAGRPGGPVLRGPWFADARRPADGAWARRKRRTARDLPARGHRALEPGDAARRPRDRRPRARRAAGRADRTRCLRLRRVRHLPLGHVAARGARLGHALAACRARSARHPRRPARAAVPGLSPCRGWRAPRRRPARCGRGRLRRVLCRADHRAHARDAAAARRATARVHGLFTYTLAEALASAPAASYRQLAQFVFARYAART